MEEIIAGNNNIDVIEMENPVIAPEIGAQAGGPRVENESEISIDLSEIARMIPDKMAFKIGEVADIAGVKAYVLRYWESEFEALSPQKSAFNQRVYARKDVETVLLIKKLLYEEKFSIAGAKRKIHELRRGLKAEKKWIEVHDKMDQALTHLEELVRDISVLKHSFADT